MVLDDAHPEPLEEEKAPRRATDEVAKRVGVSRQTVERVEAVKGHDPLLAKRMLDGNISVASAFKKVKVARVAEKAKQEEAEDKRVPGLVRDLADVAFRYRCLYLDPPWQYGDTRSRGSAEGHYPTMSESELAELPVASLLHPDGAHVWLWTTWPMIREGVPHRLLTAWRLRWMGEIVWDKETLGVGHWVRGRTEVLILAMNKNLSLLSDRVDQLVASKREAHSKKPERFVRLIEEVSVGPRLELFSRSPREGWDRWGYEA